jgi:hypothetical protein
VGKAWRRQVLETFQPQAADRKKEPCRSRDHHRGVHPRAPGLHHRHIGTAGSIGAAEKSILIDAIAIMLAIVAPTIVAIFGFSWWFRASGTRAHHLPGWTPI